MKSFGDSFTVKLEPKWQTMEDRDLIEGYEIKGELVNGSIRIPLADDGQNDGIGQLTAIKIFRRTQWFAGH